ncbi:MAG: GHKL domain-containing protein [Clostridiales bacterium]|nr:GHKL domain-containing protein [Clostridiales bacterium]
MNDLLQFLSRAAVNFFDIYICVRFFGIVLGERGSKKTLLRVTILTALAVRLVLTFYKPYVWVNFAISILLILMLTIGFHAPLKKKILAALLVNLMIALSETVIAVLIGFKQFSFLQKGANNDNIPLFLSLLLFWAIMTLTQWLITRKKRKDKIAWKVVILEVLVTSVVVFELIAVCLRREKISDIEPAILFAAECTVYLMIFLKDTMDALYTSRQEGNLIKQEKEFYRREAAIIEKKHGLEQQFRHDMKNRIQVLRNIAKTNNVDELNKYLSELETRQKQNVAFSDTGNLIIDSIINSKLQDAADKGIEVSVRTQLPNDLEANSDDMVVILGNLLDNAIEACERVAGNKYVHFVMKYEMDCIFITIHNSFDGIVKNYDNGFRTRKEDSEHHGIGLRSVKKTIDEYNGSIDFSCEEKDFGVNVLLYV